MGETWPTEHRSILAPDGRDIEFVVAGPERGIPLVFHHGTPGAAVSWPQGTSAAAELGLRSVYLGRPGYGRSTPRPGRTVADVADDVAAVLAGLNVEHFVTAGWSGGGPHALASATLLSGRCLAAATIAGVAPYEAPDLDWLEGMGPENQDEFALAATVGGDALRQFLEQAGGELRRLQPGQVADALGGLISEPDRAALHGSFAEYMAASMRLAVSSGIEGWYDDDRAFLRPWGFDLALLAVPTTVWRADLDLMVPAAHGAWLALHLPDAEDRLVTGEGHVSLLGRHFPAVAARLAEHAGV